MPAKWAGRPVLVRWKLKRTMYDFKNSFSFAVVYIHRAKYIFSRDMFCLPHFWAKNHGVYCILKKSKYLGRYHHLRILLPWLHHWQGWHITPWRTLLFLTTSLLFRFWTDFHWLFLVPCYLNLFRDLMRIWTWQFGWIFLYLCLSLFPLRRWAWQHFQCRHWNRNDKLRPYHVH